MGCQRVLDQLALGRGFSTILAEHKQITWTGDAVADPIIICSDDGQRFVRDEMKRLGQA